MTPKITVPDGAREILPTKNVAYWGGVLRPYVDGKDLVCRGVVATRFGGADDALDSGVTASGISTKDNPHLLCVALPMSLFRTFNGVTHEFPATAGSPIPKLPYRKTLVRVSGRKTNQSAVVPLLDLGPAIGTGNGLDMSNALVEALGLSLDDGEYLVDFRIIGAAEYVKQ